MVFIFVKKYQYHIIYLLSFYFRYLATGNTQISMSFSFRISPQSISVILREVMQTICKILGPIYLPKLSEENWTKNEEGYSKIWNFPNACGAMDGKNIKIRSLRFSGSTYYNYKHFYSIVLLAVVDPFYKFTVVDIGASGSQSDGGVYARSPLGKMIENGIPDPKKVGQKVLPHVILSDDAFSLKPNVMKPWPGKFLSKEKRIFNYRLSSARMVVENSFGILAALWRIFYTTITGDLDLVNLLLNHL